MTKPRHQKIIKRLQIIEGQIRGLQNMLARDRYCIEVLHQASAVKQALSGVEDAILETHLNTCVIEQIKANKSSKVVKEILKSYKLAKKR